MKPANTIRIVVETPKGSTQKYDYDAASHFFELKKMLPAGMAFPYDFGFIPGTQGEDGDPLDVVVISEFSSFTGCLMAVRVIGTLEAEQSEDGKKIRNDRYLVVPEMSLVYKKIRSMNDLPKKLVDDLAIFFVNYNQAEGRKFKITHIAGAASALRSIEKNRMHYTPRRASPEAQ